MAITWLNDSGQLADDSTRVSTVLGLGLTQLICGDVLRPSGRWLLATRSPRRLAEEMARVRDTDGFAALAAAARASVVGYCTTRAALEHIAIIMAAKGGCIGDITPGDSLELVQDCDQLFADSSSGHGPFFYQLLHAIGVFPPVPHPPSGCSTPASKANSPSSN